MQVAGTTNDIESFKSQSIDKLKCEVYLLLLETGYIDTLNKREPLYKPDWVQWRQSVRLYFSECIDNINSCSSIDQIQDILIQISWPIPPFVSNRVLEYGISNKY